MVRPVTDSRGYRTALPARKANRHIPLTAFTLFTVPEESMLSEFARSDTGDIGLRLMSLSTRAEHKNPNSNPQPHDHSDRKSATTSEEATATVNTEEDMDASNAGDALLERDLIKFMGAMTAYVSPKEVIKTIAASQGSIIRTSTGS